MPDRRQPRRLGQTVIAVERYFGRNPAAASFDNLQPVRKTYLTEPVGSIPDARTQICRALSALADC